MATETTNRYEQALTTVRDVMASTVYAPDAEIETAARIAVRTYRPHAKVVENVRDARIAIMGEVDRNSPCSRLAVLKAAMDALAAANLNAAMPEVRFIAPRHDDTRQDIEGVAVNVDGRWWVLPTCGGSAHWITAAQLATDPGVRLAPTF